MQMNVVLIAMLCWKLVVHLIIDKIRDCTTMPNLALDFFTHLMHPCPTCRLTATAALHHPYHSASLLHMRSPTVPMPPHCLVPPDRQQQPGMLRAVTQVASFVRPIAAPVSAVARLLQNSLGHIMDAVLSSEYTFIVEDRPLQEQSSEAMH